MKHRSRSSHTFETPLVLLADMLSTTVGIMVFVLVLAVLTAGSTIVIRTLPLEQETGKNPVLVICAHDRVLCPDFDAVLNTIFTKLGKPTTMKNLNEWGHTFDKLSFNQQGMHVACHADFANYLSMVFLARATINCMVLDSAGENTEQAKTPGSVFQSLLHRHSAQDAYIVFRVYPDGVGMFERVKALAMQAGFATGWYPAGPGDSLQGVVYDCMCRIKNLSICAD